MSFPYSAEYFLWKVGWGFLVLFFFLEGVFVVWVLDFFVWFFCLAFVLFLLCQASWYLYSMLVITSFKIFYKYSQSYCMDRNKKFSIKHFHSWLLDIGIYDLGSEHLLQIKP